MIRPDRKAGDKAGNRRAVTMITKFLFTKPWPLPMAVSRTMLPKTLASLDCQRPELPKPWLPLAPLVSSVDSVTVPVSTGVGTNCAILSPDRTS
jgi:hypothetical protein